MSFTATGSPQRPGPLTIEKTADPERSRLLVLLAAGAAAVVLAGGVAFALTSDDGSQTQGPVSVPAPSAESSDALAEPAPAPTSDAPPTTEAAAPARNPFAALVTPTSSAAQAPAASPATTSSTQPSTASTASSESGSSTTATTASKGSESSGSTIDTSAASAEALAALAREIDSADARTNGATGSMRTQSNTLGVVRLDGREGDRATLYLSVDGESVRGSRPRTLAVGEALYSVNGSLTFAGFSGEVALLDYRRRDGGTVRYEVVAGRRTTIVLS